MSRVGTGDSKSTHQSRLISGYLTARWFCNAAVQTSATHLQVLPGPAIRKRDREADAVSLAIRTHALIHDSIDAAMCGKHRPVADASAGRAACRNGRGPSDFKCDARAFELRDVFTFRIRLSKRCEWQRHDEGRYDEKLH